MFLEAFHPAISYDYSYNYYIRIFVKTKRNHSYEKHPSLSDIIMLIKCIMTFKMIKIKR